MSSVFIAGVVEIFFR